MQSIYLWFGSESESRLVRDMKNKNKKWLWIGIAGVAIFFFRNKLRGIEEVEAVGPPAIPSTLPQKEGWIRVRNPIGGEQWLPQSQIELLMETGQIENWIIYD